MTRREDAVLREWLEDAPPCHHEELRRLAERSTGMALARLGDALETLGLAILKALRP